MPSLRSSGRHTRLDSILTASRKAAERRRMGYRELALRMYPWVCGRCRREFTRANLQELTIHHRNHDHNDNPPDGSNWELLCIYCHDNEHARQLIRTAPAPDRKVDDVATDKPFAELRAMFPPKGKR